MSEPNPPPGFEPLFRTSPFLDTSGRCSIARRRTGSSSACASCRKHANARGVAHGGLLITLCRHRARLSHDVEQTRPRLITASLTADFAGSAKVGDWVEAHVDVQKVGGRIAFANASSWSTASASCGRARCSPARRR